MEKVENKTKWRSSTSGEYIYILPTRLLTARSLVVGELRRETRDSLYKSSRWLGAISGEFSPVISWIMSKYL